MCNIHLSLIKKLRKLTGLGIMKCKKALIESKGDIELAIDNMRKLGQETAVDKFTKNSTEGIILSNIKNNLGILLEVNCETDFVAKNNNFLLFCQEVLTKAINEKDINILKLRKFFFQKNTMLMSQMDEKININRIAILKGNNLGSYIHGKKIGVLVSILNANKDLMKHIAMHIAASNPKYISPENIPSKIIDREYQIQKEIVKKLKKTTEIEKKIIEGRIKKFKNDISLIKQKFILNIDKTVDQILKESGAKIIDFIRFELGETIK